MIWMEIALPVFQNFSISYHHTEHSMGKKVFAGYPTFHNGRIRLKIQRVGYVGVGSTCRMSSQIFRNGILDHC